MRLAAALALLALALAALAYAATKAYDTLTALDAALPEAARAAEAAALNTTLHHLAKALAHTITAAVHAVHTILAVAAAAMLIELASRLLENSNSDKE